VNLTGKRVLLLGAETDLGAEVASALAEAGATLALVSSTDAGDAAFAVKRLARKLGAFSQAIDASNEMAVRVMVRQVAKELGSLDATVICTDSEHIERFATREMEKGGGGVFVDAREAADVAAAVAGESA